MQNHVTKIILLLTLTALLAVFMAACGGGSGNNTNLPPGDNMTDNDGSNDDGSEVDDNNNGNGGEPAPTAPATPQNFQATAGKGKITITWDSVVDASSYFFHWGTEPGAETNGRVVILTDPVYEHEKLVYGTNYYYVVKARNSAGLSSATNEVTATPERLLISDIQFGDSSLETCVLLKRDSNNYVYADELTSLTCYNYGISDLAGIGWLTNLEKLEMEANLIATIDALESLASLRILDLVNNNISDISILSGLRNLENLVLEGNNISSIQPLRNLSGLLTLDLRSNAISDISYLTGTRNIQKLYLKGNAISDFSVMNVLFNLEVLDLTNTGITDISMLSNRLTLERLYLSENAISDFTPLSNLGNLIVLTLSNTGMNDVTILSNLIDLQYVYLNDNNITAGVNSLGSLSLAVIIDFSGNSGIPCADLDSLQAALPSTNIISTVSCP